VSLARRRVGRVRHKQVPAREVATVIAAVADFTHFLVHLVAGVTRVGGEEWRIGRDGDVPGARGAAVYTETIIPAGDGSCEPGGDGGNAARHARVIRHASKLGPRGHRKAVCIFRTATGAAKRRGHPDDGEVFA